MTGATGVDNQLATLVPTLDLLLGGDGLDGAIRDQIEAGRLSWILEVRTSTATWTTPWSAHTRCSAA